MTAVKKRWFILLFLLVIALLSGIGMFLVRSIPVSPSPWYDLDSYKEWSDHLEGWDQTYLLPDQDDLQIEDSNILYRLKLKDRRSYEPTGYVCSVNNWETDDEKILYICAEIEDVASGMDLELDEKILYHNTELFYGQKDGRMQVSFSFHGVYYQIQTGPRAPTEAQDIAKDMLDSES